MEKARVRIIASGAVQGVGYRNHIFKHAKELGINGWVRNLDNGKVEVMLEGEKQKLEQMINWAQKGPLSADVLDLEVEWQEFKNEFNDFSIRY